MLNGKKAFTDVQKKLSRLAEIDGFLGTALFSAEGRLLAKCEPVDIDLKLTGSLANNVLTNIHKASLDMGFGRAQFTYIQTEKTLILLRCLNEGKNPLRAEPGKCHIHLILMVDNPDSLGIARLEINRVIESLAEDFRMPLPAALTRSAVQARTKPDQSGAIKLKKKCAAKQNLQEVISSLDNEKIDKVLDDLLI